MSRKSSSNIPTVKAIKAVLSPEDIAKAKEITRTQGIKLQNFYGHAIRSAVKEAENEGKIL